MSLLPLAALFILFSPSASAEQGCDNTVFAWQVGPYAEADYIDLCYIDLNVGPFLQHMEFVPFDDPAVEGPIVNGISGSGVLNGSNVHWGGNDCSAYRRISAVDCPNAGGEIDGKCFPVYIKGTVKNDGAGDDGDGNGSFSIGGRGNMTFHIRNQFGQEENVAGRSISHTYSGCLQSPIVSITKSVDDPDNTITVGDEATYTIDYTVTGAPGQTVTDLTITDTPTLLNGDEITGFTIPPDQTLTPECHLTSDPIGLSCTFESITLNASGTYTGQIQYQITGEAEGRVNNEACVSVSEVPEECDEEEVVIEETPLEITKSADPILLRHQDRTRYEVTVTNSGDETQEFQLTDIIEDPTNGGALYLLTACTTNGDCPSGITFTPENSGSCQFNGELLSNSKTLFDGNCSLNAGAQLVLWYIMEADATGIPQGQTSNVENIAQILKSDIVIGEAQEVVTIEQPTAPDPYLTIEKTVNDLSEDTVQVDEVAQYRIVVTAHDGDLTGVTLDDVFDPWISYEVPPYLPFELSPASDVFCDFDSTSGPMSGEQVKGISCALGDMQEGESIVIEYTGRFWSPHTRYNTATVDSNETDPVEDDATLYIVDAPIDPYLTISKTISDTPTTVGSEQLTIDVADTAYYQVAIEAHEGTVHNVRLTDYLTGIYVPSQHFTFAPGTPDTCVVHEVFADCPPDDVSCEGAGPRVTGFTCSDLGGLNDGEQLVIRYSVYGWAENVIPNTATADDAYPDNGDDNVVDEVSDNAQLTIIDDADPYLTIDKTVNGEASDTINVGETAQYEIVVTAHDGGIANVQLEDVITSIPRSHFTLSPSSAEVCDLDVVISDVECPVDQPNCAIPYVRGMTCDLGDLNVGDQFVIEYSLYGWAEHVIHNTATADGDTVDPVSDNAQLTITDTAPSFVIEKFVSKIDGDFSQELDQVNAADGEPVYYMVRITNTGGGGGTPGEAVVSVYDLLADGTAGGELIYNNDLSYPTSICYSGTFFDSATPLACNLPNGSVEITYSYIADTDGMTADTSVFDNVVTLLNGDGEVINTDDARVTLTEEDAPSFTVDKTADPDVVRSSDADHSIDYEIVVTNTTDQNVDGVVIHDVFDPNDAVGNGIITPDYTTLAFGPATASCVSVTGTGNLYRCDFGPSETITITYTATADFSQMGDGETSQIVNTATAIHNSINVGEDQETVTLIEDTLACTLDLVGSAPSRGNPATLQWTITGSPDTAHFDPALPDGDDGPIDPLVDTTAETAPLSAGTHTYDLHLNDSDAATCSVTFTVPSGPNDDEVDLFINKTADKDTVAPGQTIEYRLDYGNNGDKDALGVTITDDFAEEYFVGETVHVTYTPTGVSCSVVTEGSNKKLHCNLGTLRDHRTGYITYEATLKSSYTSGTIPNTVIIENHEDSDTDHESVQIVSGGLTLSKNVNDNTLVSGQVATYRIEVYNGKSTTESFTIEDDMDTEGSNGGSLTSVENSQNITFEPASAGIATGDIGSGSLQIRNLRPGGRVIVEYGYRANNVGIPDRPETSAFTNVVRIVGTDLTDTETVSIYGPAGGGGGGGGGGGRRESSDTITIALEKYAQDAAGLWQEADTLGSAAVILPESSTSQMYKIVVQNTGNQDARNVVIQDTFASSDYTRMQISAVEGASYEASTRRFTIDRIHARESTTITYRATLETKTGASAPWSAENTAVVKNIESMAAVSPLLARGTIDINGLNALDRAYVKTEEAAIDRPLTLKKSVDKEYAKAGEEIIYTIFVYNRDTIDYKNLVITDVFPFERAELLTAPGMTSTSLARNEITFHRDELKAGEIWTLQVRARIKDTVPAGNWLKNVVTITSDTTDLTGLRAEAITTVYKEDIPEVPETPPLGASLILLLSGLSTLGLMLLWKREALFALVRRRP